MVKTDESNELIIYDAESLGEVKIANEVIAIIAGLAASEVDGVACMAGNITNELIAKLGVKNLTKGVKIELRDAKVYVQLSINIDYNVKIVEVSQKVQEKVKNSIENMTGLEVAEVNVKVVGIDRGMA